MHAFDALISTCTNHFLFESCIEPKIVRMWHETQNKDWLWDMRKFYDLNNLFTAVWWCIPSQYWIWCIWINFWRNYNNYWPLTLKLFQKQSFCKIAEIALGTLCCLMRIQKKKFTLSLTQWSIQKDQSLYFRINSS